MIAWIFLIPLYHASDLMILYLYSALEKWKSFKTNIESL